MTFKQACWDTETSGVDTENDRIITAFISIRDGDRILKEHSWIIDPGVEIPEEASAIHGMATEWVRANGRKDVRVAIEEIVHELSEAAHAGYVITGYNNSFDLAMLEAEAKRYNPGIEGLRIRESGRFVDPIILDRAIDKYRKGSRKLKDVAAHYGITFDEEKLHDASEDVRVTAELVPKVLNATVKARPELQGLSPDEIIDKLQEFQKDKKAGWARGLTEYFARTGKTEEDGSAIAVNGAFPW